jgi:hypothetical protein
MLSGPQMKLAIAEATVHACYISASGLLRESLARDIDRSLDDAFGFAEG